MATEKKNPNYCRVIVLSIIFIVLFLGVKDDIKQYMEIVDKRNCIDEIVRKDKSLEQERIEELYEQCNQEMQNLSQKSKLGKILVEIDTEEGTLAAYIITTGIEMIILCIVCTIIFDLFIQNKRRKLIMKKEQVY